MPDHPQEYVERLQQEGKVLYQMCPKNIVSFRWVGEYGGDALGGTSFR